MPKTATKKAPATFDASAVETHKCAGACKQKKPVKAFPTVTGTTNRVTECRTCRNERTAAEKAARQAAKG